MRIPFLNRSATPLSVYIKCGAILLLFLFSVLIAACGSNAFGNSVGQPPVTVTINLNGSSPTPPLSGYYCNAWVTSTTPGINTSGIVPVYAKYVQQVNNNPQGVGAASAVATVQWADGSIVTVDATTTPDGLAVFPLSTANRGADIGKFTFVTVTFSKQGTPGCAITGNQAVFFSLIYSTASITATPATTATQCVTPGPGNGPITTATPGTINNIPGRKKPTPTPSPTTPPSPTPPPCG